MANNSFGLMGQIPIKKSKKVIQDYLEYGPIVGDILQKLKQQIITKSINVKDISIYLDKISESELLDKFKDSVSFPFRCQTNGITSQEYGRAVCISIDDCIAHGGYTTESLDKPLSFFLHDYP